MKNILLFLGLVVITSCASIMPVRQPQTRMEKAKSCVTEVMERFGETSKEALETCLAIYRRKR